MDLQARFYKSLPGAFFLDSDDPGAVRMYLEEKGLLEPEERLLSIEPAGEGNVNCVVRLHTSLRTLILRQARPWVERKPEEPLPASRLEREAAFYKLVQKHLAWNASTPDVILFDKKNSILAMEDLGAGKDFSSMYNGRKETDPAEIRGLLVLLSHLHNDFPSDLSDALPEGSEVRNYIWSHTFFLPYQISPDQPSPAIRELSNALRNDSKIRRRVEECGQDYKFSTSHLLHGDFTPGSWLKTENGLFVIDPEFCCFGPAEYDCGVWAAHLALCGYSVSEIRSLFSVYNRPPGFRDEKMWHFAATEIIRRLLGPFPPAGWNASENGKLMVGKMAMEWLSA